jgi:hypothetical protein
MDSTVYRTLHSGSSIPTAATAGYNPGAIFNLTNATLGQSTQWVNQGTADSCLFVPMGSVVGYGINAAGGPVDCVNGSAASTLGQDLVMATDIAFSGHAVSDDNDQIISVIATAGKANITSTASADPLTAHDYVWAALRNKCIPTWDVFAAGTTATAGGNVAEAITVTGALVGDIALANYSATDDTDTISDVAVTADTVTVTASADPSTTHGYHYAVMRPRGTFAPSHYIAYAGVHTTVGTAAAEPITVTGALATDIPIVVYNTTNDSDTILKVVVTADTVTVTCSADPSTAHKLAYMLLRAY